MADKKIPLFIHLLAIDGSSDRYTEIERMIDRSQEPSSGVKFIANGDLQVGHTAWHQDFQWYKIPSKVAGVLLTDSIILDNYVMIYNESDYYIGIPEGKFREFQDFLFGIRTE